MTVINAHSDDWDSLPHQVTGWAAARLEDPKTVRTTGASIFPIVQQYGTPDNWNINRGGLVFDTTGLDPGLTITDAVIYVNIGTDYDTVGGSLVLADASSVSLPADTGTFAELVGLSEITRIADADLPTGQYIAIAIPSDELGFIQKGSLTHVGVYYSADFDNNSSVVPEGDVYGYSIHAQEAGTRPAYMVINAVVGEPYHVWTEGTKLHYLDANGIEREFEGTDTTSDGEARHLFVEGTYLHYLDMNRDERRQEGTAEGATGATPYQMWIEGMRIRYIDADGDERYIEGT